MTFLANICHLNLDVFIILHENKNFFDLIGIFLEEAQIPSNNGYYSVQCAQAHKKTGYDRYNQFGPDSEPTRVCAVRSRLHIARNAVSWILLKLEFDI